MAFTIQCMRLLIIAAMLVSLASPSAQGPLDREAQRWVDATMKKLTTDQMVGQLLMPRFAGVYTSSDSDIYDQLSTLVQRGARWRRHRFRRRGAGPASAAQPHLRPHHPRPAAGAGFDDQSSAVDCDRAAADRGRFRVGRRNAHSRAPPAFRGRWRLAPPATSNWRPKRGASPRPKDARSVCTSTSHRLLTSTTTRAIRSSTFDRLAKIRHASARSPRLGFVGLQQGGMLATLEAFSRAWRHSSRLASRAARDPTSSRTT